MLSNNVVTFPKSSIDLKNISEVDVEEKIELLKQYHIEETLSVIIPSLFNKLEISGFMNDDENEYLKDGALIVESIRSFMLKYYSIYHPFQQISNTLFYIDRTDPLTLKIQDSATIEFNNTKGEK